MSEGAYHIVVGMVVFAVLSLLVVLCYSIGVLDFIIFIICISFALGLFIGLCYILGRLFDWLLLMFKLRFKL